MYYGSVDFTKLQSREILNLLLSSDELGLQPLVTYTQDTLIENHSDFIIKNIIEIIELIYQKKSFDNLWVFCLQEICDNSDHLFKSTKFLSFNPSILEIILKRDDCFVNEIIVWENLLKWACGQNPVIQQDINKWSKNEFTVMERRLSRFIPSIRFYHISSEDFLLKIYPFKELLPNDLINNIFAYHMKPNNRQNIDIVQHCQKSRYDSVIITSQYFNIFASWIEKKNNTYYNIRNNTYIFKLLYRASRDGNTVAAFHKKCYNKGSTIVIAKIANSEQIVGGYNPLDWKPGSNHNSRKSINDSFIFSFTDRNNLQTADVSYSNDSNNGHQCSNICHSIFGPAFGGVHDDLNTNFFANTFFLRVCLNNGGGWVRNPHTYSIDSIPYNCEFNVSDYEVFQINDSCRV